MTVLLFPISISYNIKLYISPLLIFSCKKRFVLVTPLIDIPLSIIRTSIISKRRIRPFPRFTSYISLSTTFLHLHRNNNIPRYVSGIHTVNPIIL